MTNLNEWIKSKVRALCRRPLVLAVIALMMAPISAQAIGLGDIISLIKTITSTLQKPIG